MSVRVFGNCAPACAQCAFRGIQESCLAKNETQSLQSEGGNSVARWHGFVRERFAAVNERFVVVRGEEETAARDVLEVFEHQLGNLLCECKMSTVPARLQ